MLKPSNFPVNVLLDATPHDLMIHTSTGGWGGGGCLLLHVGLHSCDICHKSHHSVLVALTHIMEIDAEVKRNVATQPPHPSKKKYRRRQ